jgi:hypothetical protein
MAGCGENDPELMAVPSMMLAAVPEDPNTEAYRVVDEDSETFLFYLIVSEGRGYRLECDDDAARIESLAGFGFLDLDVIETRYMSDALIGDSAYWENPRLVCGTPAAKTAGLYEFKLTTDGSLVATEYYLVFSADKFDPGYEENANNLYMPGCAEAIGNFGTNVCTPETTQEMDRDFFEMYIPREHINCRAGQPQQPCQCGDGVVDGGEDCDDGNRMDDGNGS